MVCYVLTETASGSIFNSASQRRFATPRIYECFSTIKNLNWRVMIRYLSLATPIGVIAAALGSALVSFLSTFFVGFVHHPLESFPLLIKSSLIPSIAAAIIIDIFSSYYANSFHKRILVSIGVAIAVVVCSLCFGNLVIPFLSGRIFRNVLFTAVENFLWGLVYGVLFLPISYPIAFYTIKLLLRWK